MRIRPTFVFLLATITLQAASADEMPKQDTMRGAKDHPLLSRFEGSKIIGYDVKRFDEAMLPAGKRNRDKSGRWGFENTLQLEGKVTRILYNYPRDRSSLEVLRNYQAAMEKAGMKVLFTCAKEACGENFGDYMLEGRVDKVPYEGSSSYKSPFNYGRRDMRYLVAKGTAADGAVVHASVYVTAPVQDKNGGVLLEVVEGKPMETDKVSAALNAGDMARSIAAEGKVAVYGVYFDTDKADVKPESKAALAEMARLLQQDPKLKVHIVGHTDNQGTVAHNLELSQKRAESVVRQLAAEYEIDGKRLSAKGVGAYAPVASNDAETGRGKNRRVELVKQ